MINEIPQHPGAQRGLGSPTAAQQPQAAPNPYVQPNVALQASTGQITGANELAMAQAAQAGAQAGKAQAEAEILQYGAQQLAKQGLQPGPQITPQQVQAEQMADAIVQGKLSQEQLGSLIQAGEVDPGVAEAAVGMAQKFMSQEPVMPQGLGGGF